jgi:hypothetical protein
MAARFSRLLTSPRGLQYNSGIVRRGNSNELKKDPIPAVVRLPGWFHRPCRREEDTQPGIGARNLVIWGEIDRVFHVPAQEGALHDQSFEDLALGNRGPGSENRKRESRDDQGYRDRELDDPASFYERASFSGGPARIRLLARELFLQFLDHLFDGFRFGSGGFEGQEFFVCFDRLCEITFLDEG